MQSYFLTPLEHSLVVALALECEPWRKKGYKPVQLSDKQDAYVAARSDRLWPALPRNCSDRRRRSQLRDGG